MMSHPEKYAEVVLRIRSHLATQHSYSIRMQQLIELAQS
jgi:hypothetical protein